MIEPHVKGGFAIDHNSIENLVKMRSDEHFACMRKFCHDIQFRDGKIKA